jgi:transposase
MTGKIEQVEVITSVQRRRRWSADEKVAIVQETYAPGPSVSLVARRHGIAPNQLFTWRRLYASGALSAVGAGEEVVAASEYRALQHQVRELQRPLPMRSGWRAQTSPPRRVPLLCLAGAGGDRSPRPSCWPRSKRLLPVNRPTATAGCTR